MACLAPAREQSRCRHQRVNAWQLYRGGNSRQVAGISDKSCLTGTHAKSAGFPVWQRRFPTRSVLNCRASDGRRPSHVLHEVCISALRHRPGFCGCSLRCFSRGYSPGPAASECLFSCRTAAPDLSRGRVSCRRLAARNRPENRDRSFCSVCRWRTNRTARFCEPRAFEKAGLLRRSAHKMSCRGRLFFVPCFIVVYGLGAPMSAFANSGPAAGNFEQQCAMSRHLQLHSITLSARKRRPDGISCPIAFAALRLMTNSKCVGCSTGMSDGLAPRKTFTTIRAR